MVSAALGFFEIQTLISLSFISFLNVPFENICARFWQTWARRGSGDLQGMLRHGHSTGCANSMQLPALVKLDNRSTLDKWPSAWESCG